MIQERVNILLISKIKVNPFAQNQIEWNKGIEGFRPQIDSWWWIKDLQVTSKKLWRNPNQIHRAKRLNQTRDPIVHLNQKKEKSQRREKKTDIYEPGA